MIDAVEKKIRVQAGKDFKRTYRLVDEDGDPWAITAAVAEVFDKYGTGKTSLMKFTCDVTAGATGYVTVTASAATTGAVTDPGGTEAIYKRWGVWQLECTLTDGATPRVQCVFFGPVDLLRDLNPSAPA